MLLYYEFYSILLYVGEVRLTKKKILINTEINLCLSCEQNFCLHYQAVQLCSEIQCFVLVEARYYKGNPFFSLDTNTLF